MSKYRVKPASRCDYGVLAYDTPEARLWSLLTPENFDNLLRFPAWSGFVDDRLVAMGGLVLLWPGLAEGWVAVTPLAKAHPRFVLTETRKFLDVGMSLYDLRRVEAKVQADFTQANRFIQALKFKPLAPLRKYGPAGEDFILYEKVM